MTTRPSPFHVRTAEHNFGNDWVTRGGFTVPARFGDPRQEALAARAAAVVIDASYLSRLRIVGSDAEKLLSMACGSDLSGLQSGSSRPVCWCADGGALRGMGVAARFGATNFVLRSFLSDAYWFHARARRFDASVRDETAEKGVLFLLGPMAMDLVAAAGMEDAASIEPGAHAIISWRGINVTASRWSVLSQSLSGVEIGCANEDAVPLFDRLLRAGRNFGLTLAGQSAFETLLLEEGVVIPGMDFSPAETTSATEPRPSSFGLAHAQGDARRALAGLELEDDKAHAFAPVFQNGRAVGATLRSAYSPVLRRAIALAELDKDVGAPGTSLQVRHLTKSGIEDISAQVTLLPFVTKGFVQKSELHQSEKNQAARPEDLPPDVPLVSKASD